MRIDNIEGMSLTAFIALLQSGGDGRTKTLELDRKGQKVALPAPAVVLFHELCQKVAKAYNSVIEVALPQENDRHAIVSLVVPGVNTISQHDTTTIKEVFQLANDFTIIPYGGGLRISYIIHNVLNGNGEFEQLFE